MSEKRETNRHVYLTETPIPKLIWSLAVPTIISMLVTGIYNSADTYFVGRISTEATAAVGLVFSVMAIIQAGGFFCGQGSGNYLSRLLGAGQKEEAEEVAITGFVMAFVIGALFAVIGNLFAGNLADFIGATPASRADTVAYLRIILLGAPFMMCQFVINNQLRFQGSAMYAMVGLLCGAIMNIGLDPLLMFGFGMGIRGAALATVCGQITSFTALLIGSEKGENIHLRLSRLKWNLHHVTEISNGGMPSLMRQGMAAISALLLNRVAMEYGADAAVAGMSIVSRVMMLLLSVLIGFGQGYQPVCSYNYGAGYKKRVRDGFWYCVRYGTAMMTIAGVICFIFAEPIVSWFRNDPEVVRMGSLALHWQSAVLPLLAFSILTNMVLQATGKGLKASITSSARNGLFFIPLILILPRIFGFAGVAMTQAWADIITFILCLIVVQSELKTFEDAA